MICSASMVSNVGFAGYTGILESNNTNRSVGWDRDETSVAFSFPSLFRSRVRFTVPVPQDPLLLHRTALTRVDSAARYFATGRQSLPLATTATGAGVVNCSDVSETVALQPPRSDNLRLRRVKPRPPRPSVRGEAGQRRQRPRQWRHLGGAYPATALLLAVRWAAGGFERLLRGEVSRAARLPGGAPPQGEQLWG